MTQSLKVMELKAIELIGAHIQTYGHFACYIIPNEANRGIISESEINKEEFLKLVYDYYYSDKLNLDYFDNIKESNSIKKFIKGRVNEESYNIGKIWLENQTFKE